MKKIYQIFLRIIALVVTGLCISVPISDWQNGSEPYVIAIDIMFALVLWFATVSILASESEK